MSEPLLPNEMRDRLHLLDPLERRVICLLHNIKDKEYTLAEVGKIFDVSRERIRQIQDKTLRKLKYKMKKRGRTKMDFYNV